MATAKRPSKKPNINKNNINKKVVNNKKSKLAEKNNNEIYGIIAITCSLIFMFSLYTNKLGYLSILSKKIFITLFGVAAFVLPIYCLYVSIKYYFLKEPIKFSRKYIGIIGAFITTLILIQTMQMNIFYVKGNLMDSFNKFLNSTSYLHGGIITFLFVLPIYKLIGALGIYIFIGGAYICFSIMIFNYNIRGVAMDVQKKSTNMKNKARSSIEKNHRKTKKDYKDFDDTAEHLDIANEMRSRMKMIDFMNNSPLANMPDEDEGDIDSKNSESLDDNCSNEEILENSYENIKILAVNKQDIITEPISSNLEVCKKQEVDSEILQAETKPVIELIKNTEKNVKEIHRELNDEITKVERVKEEKTKELIVEKENIDVEQKVEYAYPSADLLNINTKSEMNSEERQELLRNANKLEEVLLSFGVQAELLDVTKGPSVTRYEIQPKAGIKVNKIVNLSHDIALGLAAAGEVRIEAPIPGKAAVGIEIPNKKQTPVYFREIIESDEFNDSRSNIACALGKSIEGKSVVADLSTMPHLLIAGATGSGKSVCINTLIVSILYKYSPDEVKLLMVDPKVVELSVYNGIPHLLIPVVTDPKKASGALFWAVKEMDRRYNLFATNGARNIESYNKMFEKGKVQEKLPYIVIIVDELADLMMVCPGDVEEYICRLAQKARAAGMHLVIATQRPSVDVITGVIKANIPSRISFSVSSQIDSRTILDSAGAEKLLGRGDMLFHPIGKSSNMRVQGAFISEEEVEQVVEHVKGLENTLDNNYEAEILKHMESAATGGKGGASGEEQDELIDEAIRLIVDSGQVSASFIQRRLKIGFNRAARIMEQLEELGIISEKDGNKPRQVLINKEDIENM
ncbi:MAG: DNA translocase FtsK [Sarcina sp.]